MPGVCLARCCRASGCGGRSMVSDHDAEPVHWLVPPRVGRRVRRRRLVEAFTAPTASTYSKAAISSAAIARLSVQEPHARQRAFRAGAGDADAVVGQRRHDAGAGGAARVAGLAGHVAGVVVGVEHVAAGHELRGQVGVRKVTIIFKYAVRAARTEPGTTFEDLREVPEGARLRTEQVLHGRACSWISAWRAASGDRHAVDAIARARRGCARVQHAINL